MARRPNYRFEKMERQRKKAARKAAKAEAKAQKSEADSPELEDAPAAPETAASDEGTPPAADDQA